MIDFGSYKYSMRNKRTCPYQSLGPIQETQKSTGQQSIYINARSRKINVQNIVMSTSNFGYILLYKHMPVRKM